VLGCSGTPNEEPPFDAQGHEVSVRDASLPRDAVADRASPPDAGHLDAAVDAPTSDAWLADFDGALTVNSGECGTGEIGATYLGIPAYCQPSSATGYYQCDELANRFVRDLQKHPDLDNVVTDYASSICGKASAMSAYSVWGPGYLPTTGKMPVGGDLVVFTGMPGHVAVVVGFVSPSSVLVIQQNAGAPTGLVPWDRATSFFAVFSRTPECWVHAESAPPAELPDASACGCFAGGDTCGLAIVDHEWWNGCRAGLPEGGVEYGSLYACDAGVFTKTADCPSLCITPDLYDASGYCGK
jgi:hypothetical protein